MSDTDTRQREAERYPHVLRAVRETPWAILPSTLGTILEVISLRVSGERLTDEEIQARVGGRAASRDVQMVGSIALLPVYGVLVPKANLFSQMSGGTSVQGLQTAFRDALEDDSVSAIVFDVDSPGGSVDLIPEFAAEIRAARGRKPIVAAAHPRAASAAYWLAAQADEVVVTRSGDVGSIGIFAAHEDVSKMQERLGVKTTLISAGKYKTEGSPFQELSEEAKAAIQGRVDEAYSMFVSDVAKGRRVSVETVRSDFGEGRMVTASQALKAGMVDRVETIDATIARLAPRRVKATPVAEPPEPDDAILDTDDGAATSGPSFADDVDTALRAVEAVVTRSEALRALTGTKRAQLAALVERTIDLLAASETTDAPEPEGLDELEISHALMQATSRLRAA